MFEGYMCISFSNVMCCMFDWCDATRSDMMLWDAMWCDLMSCVRCVMRDVCHVWCVMRCSVMWWEVTWCDVTWCDVKSGGGGKEDGGGWDAFWNERPRLEVWWKKGIEFSEKPMPAKKKQKGNQTEPGKPKLTKIKTKKRLGEPMNT